MGLDACVKCRCWEDGLCRPPASLAGRLQFDPETAEVVQTTGLNLSAEERLAFDLAFDVWIAEGACAHEDMCVARERIANWAGLREFQHALRSLGAASHAALLRELPNHSDGLTTSVDARLCLAELDHFRAARPFGHIVELLDCGSGDVIHVRIESYDGELGTNGATGVSGRLTADGLFQIEQGPAGAKRDDAAPKILFRSRHFSRTEESDGVRFTDLSSRAQLRGVGDVFYTPDRRMAVFEVRQGQDHPARYAHCVEPLRRVLQAAVDIGHPVLWR